MNIGGITKKMMPYARLLAAHAGGRNLATMISRLDHEEVAAVVGYLEGDFQHDGDWILSDLGLPKLEGNGFWRGEVLPLLQRRLDRSSRRPPPPDGNRFDAVKAAVTVTDLAARYTDLEPGGVGKLKGLCPLHKEKTPSFYVYLDDPQRWYCYGACHEGGGVIDLAMRLMDKGLL